MSPHVPQHPPPRPRRHLLLKRLTLALVLGFALLNVIAFAHAYKFTHFTVAGVRTASPEQLNSGAKLRTLLAGVALPRPLNTRTPAAVGLEYETLRFPTTDGLSLEAWWVPRADPSDIAILFHGYGGAKQSTLDEARAFWDWGFAVLLVDLRGAGGSDGQSTTLGWHEAHDVAAAVHFAQRAFEPTRVLLYGASMGAVAILRAIDVLGLEAEALILEAPFNRLLDTTANRFRQMGLPAFPCAQLLVFWGGQQHGFNGFAHAPEAYVEALERPTLLMFGGADPDVTPANAAALVSRAPACVTPTTFEGAGHPRLFPQDPARWRREVRAFLDRVLPR